MSAGHIAQRADVTDVVLRTRAFVNEVVIPIERERRGVLHDADDEFRRSLQGAARAAGVRQLEGGM
jgi:hypothetical protein